MKRIVEILLLICMIAGVARGQGVAPWQFEIPTDTANFHMFYFDTVYNEYRHYPMDSMYMGIPLSLTNNDIGFVTSSGMTDLEVDNDGDYATVLTFFGAPSTSLLTFSSTDQTLTWAATIDDDEHTIVTNVNAAIVDTSFLNELDTMYNYDGSVLVDGGTVLTDSAYIQSTATAANTDEQDLSWSSPNLSITNGTGADLSSLIGPWEESASIITPVDLSHNVEIGDASNDAYLKLYGPLISAYQNTDNLIWTNTTYSNGLSGSGNVMTGGNNGLALTTGSYNVAIGRNVLQDETTGSSNIGIGDGSLNESVGVDRNIAIGENSQREATGDDNVGIGRYTLWYATGLYNISMGYLAGLGVATGASGNDNIFLGRDSGRLYETGSNNVSIGNAAMRSLTTGLYNVSVGWKAGYSVADGDYNISLGFEAGYSNSSNKNIFIGYQAGRNATGANNIFIGDEAGENAGSVSNELWIDDTNTATPLIHGDFTANELTTNGDQKISGSLSVGHTTDPLYTLDIQGDYVYLDDVGIIDGDNSAGVAGEYLTPQAGGVEWAPLPYSEMTSAKMIKTSSTNLDTSTTPQKLVFNTTEYDNGDITSTPGTGRFAVTTAGYYECNANLQFLGDDGARAKLYIYKNGTAITNSQARIRIAYASGINSIHWTESFDLAATDYLEIYLQQDSTDGSGVHVDQHLTVGNFSIKRLD